MPAPFVPLVVVFPPSASPSAPPASPPVSPPRAPPTPGWAAPPVPGPSQAPRPGVRPPATRFCHEVSPASPYWSCVDTSFCAQGMLGETPTAASPEFSVFCRVGDGGRTESISLCRDYTIGREIVPSESTFVRQATAELLRVCPY